MGTWNIAVELEDRCGFLNITMESNDEEFITLVSKPFKNVLPK
jgi:hypothetical protein